MACFIVGGAEAVAVSAIRAAVRKREMEAGVIDEDGRQIVDASVHGVCWTRKLGWLSNMLWGGVLLLCVEHMWHGEVVPFPPFLTAMADPSQVPAMLGEMATVGVGMAAAVTTAWFGMALAADVLAKRPALAAEEA